MNIDLSEKYNIPDGHAVAPMSTLSFILRKAEMGIDLTAEEWQWLEMQQLTAAIEVIKTQKIHYKNTFREELKREIMELRNNKSLSFECDAITNVSFEMALVLYKVHNSEVVLPSEQRFVNSDYMAFALAKLKAKLAISEHIPLNATSSRILSKLLSKQKLASADLEWLHQHRVVSVADTVAQGFSSLGEKYRMSLDQLSAEARLQACAIMQALEEDKLPSNNDQDFLKQNGFTDASGIAQTLEFKALKKKFHATQIEDDTPTQHLYKVLKRLDADLPLTEPDLNFLNKRKLHETVKLAFKPEADRLTHKIKQGQSLYPDEVAWCKQYQFEEIISLSLKAEADRLIHKIEQGQSLHPDEIAWCKQHQFEEIILLSLKAEADRLLRKVEQGHGLSSDDVAWCKQNQFEKIVFLSLKKDFGIEHRKDALDSPLYQILQKLEAEQRLTDQEVIWLETEEWCGSGYMDFRHNNKIFRAHHRLEALFCEAEFKRTKNHWLLASGSAHWRKAEQAERALSLTELDIDNIREAKLRQALLTTRGGALRDLDRLGEAENCALAAIKQYSHSHNPYTLMGALCYQTGRHAEGDRWFEEAQKRGATAKDVDAEIKRILSKKKDPALIDYLLKKDPVRYAWVKKYAHKPV